MGNFTNPDQAYINIQEHPEFNELNAEFKVRKMTRNRPNKKGLVKIEIEITKYWYGGTRQYNRERIKVDTLIWVNPSNWNNKSEKLSKKEPDYEYKLNTITQIWSAIEGFVSSKGVQELDQPYVEKLDLTKLRELFPNRKKNRKTLADWIDVEYKRRINLGKPLGTTKEFLTVKNRVKKFDSYRGRKTYLEDINILWADEFYIWGINTAKHSEGTVEKSFTVLITTLNELYELRDEYNIAELTDKFRSKKFKRGTKSRNKPNALSYEQREIIYSHKFQNDHLETVRKMICLQCYTGIRYGDIRNLRPEHFLPSVEDPQALKFMPQKTIKDKVEVEQPLSPKSTALIKEVGYDTSCYSMRAQPYNRSVLTVFEKLREIYPDAGFRAKYSSHNFRDTFISIAVQRGVNFKSILKWVGQSSYAIMDRYVELSDEFNAVEMEKMN